MEWLKYNNKEDSELTSENPKLGCLHFCTFHYRDAHMVYVHKVSTAKIGVCFSVFTIQRQCL